MFMYSIKFTFNLGSLIGPKPELEDWNFYTKKKKKKTLTLTEFDTQIW